MSVFHENSCEELNPSAPRAKPFIMMIRFLLVPFILCLILALPLSSLQAANQCPDIALDEKAEDCPWAQVARALISEAEAGRPILSVMKSSLPDLVGQIEKDAKNSTYRTLWGKSINFDEFAKGVIVHPSIIKTIAKLSGTEASDRIVHAGMEHVYGYLFSTLKTPYGYKRARWVQPTLEKAFILPPKVLSPTPPEGTLFSNLTYFLGNIAFRDDPKELNSLREVKKIKSKIPEVLTSFSYGSLKVNRLIETSLVADAKGKTRSVTLRTDLVEFKKLPEGQKNSHLLIYSVNDPLLGGARLITAFPVEKGFTEKVLNPENLGQDKTIQARYNAFIEGFNGTEVKGNRQVIQSENQNQ